VENVGQQMQQGFSGISQQVESVGQQVENVGQQMQQGFSGISQQVESVGQQVENVGQQIQQGFSGISQQVESVGQQMQQGAVQISQQVAENQETLKTLVGIASNTQAQVLQNGKVLGDLKGMTATMMSKLELINRRVDEVSAKFDGPDAAGWDENRDGQVDSSEMLEMLNDMGQLSDVGDSVVRALLQTAKLLGASAVTDGAPLDKFVQEAALNLPKVSGLEAVGFTNALKGVDTDGDGRVTASELISLSSERRSGRLSFDEFLIDKGRELVSTFRSVVGANPAATTSWQTFAGRAGSVLQSILAAGGGSFGSKGVRDVVGQFTATP
jgi:hypothetical protein